MGDQHQQRPEPRAPVVIVAADINRRLSLGDLVSHSLYEARRDRDGTIILRPVALDGPEAVANATKQLERQQVRARRVR